MDANVKSVPGKEARPATVGCFLAVFFFYKLFLGGTERSLLKQSAQRPGAGPAGVFRGPGVFEAVSMINNSGIHHLALIAAPHQLYLHCAFIETNFLHSHLVFFL